jgi:hydroxymethylpyrimidine pyrophosphatase-like HAD family hydrolase
MKTLYISDLDGTLLQHDAEMSDYSGESVVFFCIKETKERLFSVVKQIRAIPGLYAPVYKDKYTDYWFCECARADASKAAAVRDFEEVGQLRQGSVFRRCCERPAVV